MDVQENYEVCRLRAEMKALQYENQMLMGLVKKFLLKEDDGKDSAAPHSLSFSLPAKESAGKAELRQQRQQQRGKVGSKKAMTSSPTKAARRYVSCRSVKNVA